MRRRVIFQWDFILDQVYYSLECQSSRQNTQTRLRISEFAMFSQVVNYENKLFNPKTRILKFLFRQSVNKFQPLSDDRFSIHMATLFT